jgi:hypothetical protein
MSTILGTVTDQDVITQLNLDDSLAVALQAAVAKLPSTASFPFAPFATTVSQYQSWGTACRQRVSGGFFFGEWFGVPDDYLQAVDWGYTLADYAPQITSAGGVAPPIPKMPPRPTPPATGSGSPLSMDSSTKLVVAVVAITILVIALKK